MIDRVSVIGLGKLGACMAAIMASKGKQVMGVDVNQNNVDMINQGQSPVVEPGLAELIASNTHRLRATTDFRTAVLKTDASFLIVPKPSDKQSSFSLKYLTQAIQEIGRILSEKSDYHLVVVTSTVLPGSMQFGIVPVLEEASGRKCDTSFGLCYNPEFIALGSVIHDLLNLDFLLIGESDQKAGNELDWNCSTLPSVTISPL